MRCYICGSKDHYGCEVEEYGSKEEKHGGKDSGANEQTSATSGEGSLRESESRDS